MQIRRFFRQLWQAVLADDIDDVGAMLAYYAIIALFPMLIFVLSLALAVLPAQAVREGATMATDAVPPSVREAVVVRVEALIRASGAGFAILGAALALWSASRGAVALMVALNRAFGRHETRPWLVRQATAIGVTLGVAVLMVLALALLVVGPLAGHWLADRFGLGGAFDTAWGIARWVGAGLLVLVVWAFIYKYLPDTHAPLRVFTPGAVCGVTLWLAISYAFGLYLAHFRSYEATYGTLGGAIIFLTWLWLSAISLLLGAEVNDVLADLRAPHDPDAAALAHDDVHAAPAPAHA